MCGFCFFFQFVFSLNFWDVWESRTRNDHSLRLTENLKSKCEILYAMRKLCRWDKISLKIYFFIIEFFATLSIIGSRYIFYALNTGEYYVFTSALQNYANQSTEHNSVVSFPLVTRANYVIFTMGFLRIQ